MNAVLFIIVALVVSAPIAAAILVSIGSRREDSDWSLGEPVVGPVQMIARRIVGFRTDCHYPKRPPNRFDAWWDRGSRTGQPVPSPDQDDQPTEPSEPLLVTSG